MCEARADRMERHLDYPVIETWGKNQALHARVARRRTRGGGRVKERHGAIMMRCMLLKEVVVAHEHRYSKVGTAY